MYKDKYYDNSQHKQSCYVFLCFGMKETKIKQKTKKMLVSQHLLGFYKSITISIHGR